MAFYLLRNRCFRRVQSSALERALITLFTTTAPSGSTGGLRDGMVESVECIQGLAEVTLCGENEGD